MKTLTILVLLLASTYSLADVKVSGYYRSNGTYVQPHYRSDPDGLKNNNWSTIGNTNPYTGKKGYLPREEDEYSSNLTQGADTHNNQEACINMSNIICPIEAKTKLNKIEKVCGKIVSFHKFKSGYYFNFDKNYPNEPLTLLIWDEKISLMSNNTGSIPSPESIVGQDICVTGKISKYKEHYQITPNSKIIYPKNELQAVLKKPLK